MQVLWVDILTSDTSDMLSNSLSDTRESQRVTTVVFVVTTVVWCVDTTRVCQTVLKLHHLIAPRLALIHISIHKKTTCLDDHQ